MEKVPVSHSGGSCLETPPAERTTPSPTAATPVFALSIVPSAFALLDLSSYFLLPTSASSSPHAHRDLDGLRFDLDDDEPFMIPAGELRDPEQPAADTHDAERQHVARARSIARQEIDAHRQRPDAGLVAYEPTRAERECGAFAKKLPELAVPPIRFDVVHAWGGAKRVHRLNCGLDALACAPGDRMAVPLFDEALGLVERLRQHPRERSHFIGARRHNLSALHRLRRRYRQSVFRIRLLGSRRRQC